MVVMSSVNRELHLRLQIMFINQVLRLIRLMPQPELLQPLVQRNLRRQHRDQRLNDLRRLLHQLVGHLVYDVMSLNRLEIEIGHDSLVHPDRAPPSQLHQRLLRVLVLLRLCKRLQQQRKR